MPVPTDKRRAHRFRAAVLRRGPFFIATLVLYLTGAQLDRAGNLHPVPTAMIFVGASAGAKVLAGVIIGSLFALNYLHFYTTAASTPSAARPCAKTVGAALFRLPTRGRALVASATVVPAAPIGQDAAAG